MGGRGSSPTPQITVLHYLKLIEFAVQQYVGTHCPVTVRMPFVNYKGLRSCALDLSLSQSCFDRMNIIHKMKISELSSLPCLQSLRPMLQLLHNPFLSLQDQKESVITTY